jgi:hypothetical protein
MDMCVKHTGQTSAMSARVKASCRIAGNRLRSCMMQAFQPPISLMHGVYWAFGGRFEGVMVCIYGLRYYLRDLHSSRCHRGGWRALPTHVGRMPVAAFLPYGGYLSKAFAYLIPVMFLMSSHKSRERWVRG